MIVVFTQNIMYLIKLGSDLSVHIEGLQKNEKICVAWWDYPIHKSSFSELSYLAFSQKECNYCDVSAGVHTWSTFCI